MYNFIDVNEQASEAAFLPSEALMLNGEYIENQISGYRTLHVQGREALSPEINTYETGIRDGSKLKNKRFPARTIIVTYQLIAESNEAFREAYNQLGGILNIEDAEMIFADEPDKYFIGTPVVIGEIEPGKNSVIGTIEFLCTDPFKYSCVEYEATAELDQNSILIDYNGTYKSYPTLQADFYNEEDVSEDGESENTVTDSGDCGYVAFFTKDKKIIQLGDPNEVDGENAYAKSQTLMNQTFKSKTAWGTTAKKLWAVNSGVTASSNEELAGTPGMAGATFAEPTTVPVSATLLKVSSTASAPTVDYTVSAAISYRGSNFVVLSIGISASLAKSSSYFGTGYILEGHVYIGGSWRTVTLKRSNDYWAGRTGHTVTFGCTVEGITETQSALTGIKFKATRPDGSGNTGVLSATSCKNLTIGQYGGSATSWYMTAADYGTGSAWHGPSITRTLKADASGEYGATNFTFTYSQKLCTSNTQDAQNEYGTFWAACLANDGTDVASVKITKFEVGKKAKVKLRINGLVVDSFDIDVSYNSKYFGSSSKAVKTTTIKKVGSKITFNVGGRVKTFTRSAVADMKTRKVLFMFEKWGGSGYKPLTYNGLYWAKFVKNNCETWKEIPNKFGPGDVLTADCENGDIRLNGILSPELGALGNDWEQFVLKPGLNQIGFSYSDWVVDGYEPTMKVKYREVFL